MSRSTAGRVGGARGGIDRIARALTLTRMKRAALLLALLLSPACVWSRTQVNVPLEAETIGALVPGTTTAAEVVELLGAPDEVIQLGRRSAYRYEHGQEKLTVLFLVLVSFVTRDGQADRSWVFFDENDVLTHVGTTLDAERAEYAMPWSSRDG